MIHIPFHHLTFCHPLQLRTPKSVPRIPIPSIVVHNLLFDSPAPWQGEQEIYDVIETRFFHLARLISPPVDTCSPFERAPHQFKEFRSKVSDEAGHRSCTNRGGEATHITSWGYDPCQSKQQQSFFGYLTPTHLKGHSKIGQYIYIEWAEISTSVVCIGKTNDDNNA